MGFFSKIGRIIDGGQKYNAMSKAIGRVIGHIDNYERYHDVEQLYAAAWLCRVGILDIIEKYNYSITATIRVPIYGKMEAMSLNAAMMRSYSRLIVKQQELLDEDKMNIEEILERGDAFYEIDKRIPLTDKKMFY